MRRRYFSNFFADKKEERKQAFFRAEVGQWEGRRGV
jgi:hypothetical protein